MASQSDEGVRVRVKLYVLDDALKETAEDIKEELTSKLSIKASEKEEYTDIIRADIVNGKQFENATEASTQEPVTFGDGQGSVNDHAELEMELSIKAKNSLVNILSFKDLQFPAETAVNNSNTGDGDGCQASLDSYMEKDAIANSEADLDINEQSYRKADDLAADCILSPDVVIILGHSSVHRVGPFCTEYILGRILRPAPPAIVAFLGCCGGGVRHGPLFVTARMPEWKLTLFGFFQRRVYIDELCKTILVQGIRNYLHFAALLVKAPISQERTRMLVRYSFACAETGKYGMKPMDQDPTMYANDVDYPDTTQQLLEVCYKIFKSGDDVRQTIPLPCLQLALYHTFSAEEKEQKLITQFIHKMEDKYDDVAKLKEMEEDCLNELEKYRIQKIVELAEKVQLLPVLDKTVDDLKEGKWKELDHLQFFVAILQGYWGENPFYLIRMWAKYHLVEILKKVDTELNFQLSNVDYWTDQEAAKVESTHVENKSDILYEYHLCSIAYCLFSKHDHIIFPAANTMYSRLTFCVWSSAETTSSNPYVLVPSGYCFKEDGLRELDPLFEIPALPRDKAELPIGWAQLFCHHVVNKHFFEVVHKCEKHVAMRNYRNPNDIYYEYKLEDLQQLFSALQVYLFKLDSNSVNVYGIEMFSNNATFGRLQCFAFPPCFEYTEMRVIHDNEYLKSIPDEEKTALHQRQLAGWSEVKRCRFVFAHYETVKDQEKMIYGFLFLTDSHYGWDEVSDEKVNELALNNLKRMDSVPCKVLEVLREWKQTINFINLPHEAILMLAKWNLEENVPSELFKLVLNNMNGMDDEAVLEALKKWKEDINVIPLEALPILTEWKLKEKVPPELLKIVLEKEIDIYDKFRYLDKRDIVKVQQLRIQKILKSSNKSDATVKKYFPFELVGRLRIMKNKISFDMKYCDDLLYYLKEHYQWDDP